MRLRCSQNTVGFQKQLHRCSYDGECSDLGLTKRVWQRPGLPLQGRNLMDSLYARSSCCRLPVSCCWRPSCWVSLGLRPFGPALHLHPHCVLPLPRCLGPPWPCCGRPPARARLAPVLPAGCNPRPPPPGWEVTMLGASRASAPLKRPGWRLFGRGTPSSHCHLRRWCRHQSRSTQCWPGLQPRQCRPDDRHGVVGGAANQTNFC